MSAHDDDCRLRDDAGPWVLGALGEPDATAFAAHLEVCDECRGEVAALQVVADVLPMAAPQVVPPPDLKGRIMAVVDSEAQLLAAAGPEADRPARADDRDRGAGLFGWLGRVRPVPAAVLATAILAVGIVAGVLATGGDGGDQTTIQGTGPSGAQVALALNDDGHGQLKLQHMPKPPSGRVYQVWLVTGQENPRPTHALFSVAEDGTASVDIPESLKGTDQVLVSDEPPGGSQQPTGSVVAGAKLS
jgi:anti-sigma-K factor RskA